MTNPKTLEPLANSSGFVTIRGQLYKKAGKKKPDLAAPFKLLVLEVQKKE